MRPRRLLVGITGGVAAYKACHLVRVLRGDGHEVRVVMTRSAQRFVGAPTFHALTGHRVYDDLWDPAASASGEPHVALSSWCEAAIVYPATADFLARMAAGRADDLLAATLLCCAAPILVCPAMHTRMYRSHFVGQSVKSLLLGGVQVLEPDTGPLASGEVGEGRLPEPEVAVEALYTRLTDRDLGGRRVLVTAGPTREYFDPVRFLSNPSTGRMGFAVARMAARRGARVTLIAGPGTLAAPRGAEVVRVGTAAQMQEAVDRHFADCDALIMSAAVCDYAPAEVSPHKLKKGADALSVTLRATPDLVQAVSSRKGDRVVVGFAMETSDLVARASDKLRRKSLDLVVGNDLHEAGAGFEVDTNVVTLIGADGSVTPLARQSKDDVADRILDHVVALLELRARPRHPL